MRKTVPSNFDENCYVTLFMLSRDRLWNDKEGMRRNGKREEEEVRGRGK